MHRERHRLGGYREFAPTANAAAFCEAFWIHRTPLRPVVPGAAHRVLPELAVSLTFQTFRDDQGRPLQGGPMIAGPKLRPQIFNIVPGRELASIRFKPEWVAPVLGVDPLDLENQVMDLALVRPGLAARLQEALMQTRTAEDAIAILARLVVGMPASLTQPSAAATGALEMVRRSAGRLPCERVAEQLGLSMRHVRRHVHDSTGISPKSYARVIRFAASMQLADASAAPAWADIAVRSGYCDQSHLIRESIALSGRSPRELHLERRRQVVQTTETR